MPALIHRQFKIYYSNPNDILEQTGIQNNRKPVAFVAWVNASVELSAHIEEDPTRLMRLELSDWSSGHNPIICMIVAPFGGIIDIRKDMLLQLERQADLK